VGSDFDMASAGSLCVRGVVQGIGFLLWLPTGFMPNAGQGGVPGDKGVEIILKERSGIWKRASGVRRNIPRFHNLRVKEPNTARGLNGYY